MALLMLGAKETSVPNEVVAKERHIIVAVTLAPLNLVSPILKAPFLAPLPAYVFIKTGQWHTKSQKRFNLCCSG